MSNLEIKQMLRLSDRAKIIKESGIRKAFEMAGDMKDVIHLGLGEPDFGAPEELKTLLKMAVDEGFSHYTPNSGFFDLRSVLSDKLRDENRIDYDPATEIMVTVGAMNAINLAMLCLVNPGDEVIIQDPAFVGFEPCTQMCGGVAVGVPLREDRQFRIDPADIRERITSRTRLLVINNPHNPTGAVLDPKDLEEIASIAREYDLFVLSDEVYEKLIYDGLEHTSMASLEGMKERTLTVMSFSKTFCICGWRIGFCAGPALLIRNMVKMQQSSSVHPAAPMQKAVMFYLNRSGEFVEYIKKAYTARRDYMTGLINQIEGIHCLKPQSAFYLFVNIKQLGCTSMEFSQLLLQEYRVITIPGSAFGPGGEGYIRICITVPVEKLQVACMRIEQAVRRFLK